MINFFFKILFCIRFAEQVLKKILLSFSFQVTICADDYKVTSYTLECAPGLFLNVQRGIETFAYKNTGLPDCDSSGYAYNYTKPFQDYCNYKESCVLSTAFLDEKGLFSAETYFLTDDSLYLKPIRIDLYYTCLGKSNGHVSYRSAFSIHTHTHTHIRQFVSLYVCACIPLSNII
jgi:hypothetical protein